MPTSRKHNPNRMLGLIRGERSEEHIDWRPLAVGRSSAPETEPPVANGQDRARRQNIDMLRLDPLAILGFDDRHPRGAAEDLGKHAVAVRRQMSDDHEGQAAICRNGFEKFLQRLDSARRGADTDDRESRRHKSTLRCLDRPRY